MPKYCEVSAIDGAMDIDYKYLREAYQVAPGKFLVKMIDPSTIRKTWTEITEQEFMAAKPAGPEEPMPEEIKTPLEEIADQLLAMDQKISQLQTDVSSIKQRTEEAVKQS